MNGKEKEKNKMILAVVPVIIFGMYSLCPGASRIVMFLEFV
jgi:hypothetical protein